ncbi:MAG: hypothetical protein JWQ90_2590 [Hydrocarboniphaga sp.]|uniref:aromatic ring-hydroxylating oxygenase subunit alpha n=1 Tax=Hydrocarboniphaga sp. TaxID=2033016 RepID=UPI00260BBEAB|nr:aromatic ring-hydroxylating dioxygenase subunit alpha [Hydrocarboniphaga sp.]MDB5970140.1 hypothetical protein [Hydrocarboniphaga sp.]
MSEDLSEVKRDVRVQADVSARLITHLRDDTTDLADQDLHVPIEHFVSPVRAKAEIALMKTLPLLVAHCSEIPNAGDFVTREVLGVALLIVRQSAGGVQAYLNMCRHRGGRVETKPSGSKRVFMCQYHGWSYERDSGALRNVPYESSFDQIDRGCNGLHRYKTEQRHGLIFVDMSNDRERSLADYLGGEVDAQITPWELEKSSIYLERTFTLDINWKLVMDGAIDILHPRFLHVGGVGELIETNVGVYRRYGRHGQHFGARTKLRKLIKAGVELNGGSKYIGSNLVIYPNAMMIAAPDHIEFWTVWPSIESPSKSITQIRFLVRSEILTPEIEKRLQKSWEILENAATKEDWPMERYIQQNAEAAPDGMFRYGRSEVSCQHLHLQLAADLAGNGG